MSALSPAITLPGSAGAMTVHQAAPMGAARGVALIVHGRNGAADQGHIRPVVDACLSAGLAVLVPDLCHSAANASGGAAGDFTMAAHLADARAALAYARTLPLWQGGPARLLIGHSMGAYAVARLAAEASDVTGVLALSPVISGTALLAAREAMGPAAIAALRQELPGAFDEWPAHDALPAADAITCPTGIIVGADDTLTPPEDARILAGRLRRLVHFEVLPGEHHCPLGAGYAASLTAALAHLLKPPAP